MAHISGYDGSIVMGTAGDTEFGPSQTNTVKLQTWTVRQKVDTFTAMAKGDAWKAKFATAADWTATVTFLMQDAAASDELAIRKAATAAKAMTNVDFITTGGDKFEGSGYAAGVDIDDPLDAPVTVTVEIEGNGALTYTAGG